MSNVKLKDRITSYQEVCDYKLLGRLPIIVTINGRAFAKSTELLDKPYCHKFAECMFSTTLKLCSEVEGALFAYHHNDEITIVYRNDQNVDTTSWYDNKIQKISSVTAAISTLHFNQCATKMNLDIVGNPIFTSQIFAVPTIMEATNTIIYKQQHNFHSSIQLACFYELLKKHDKNAIREMLNGLSIDEKIDLLQQECDVDFNQYPLSFRRGAACYRVPKVSNGLVKNKWILDLELPIFTKDQSFLTNIFKNGADLFRNNSFDP